MTFHKFFKNFDFSQIWTFRKLWFFNFFGLFPKILTFIFFWLFRYILYIFYIYSKYILYIYIILYILYNIYYIYFWGWFWELESSNPWDPKFLSVSLYLLLFPRQHFWSTKILRKFCKMPALRQFGLDKCQKLIRLLEILKVKFFF